MFVNPYCEKIINHEHHMLKGFVVQREGLHVTWKPESAGWMLLFFSSAAVGEMLEIYQCMACCFWMVSIF